MKNKLIFLLNHKTFRNIGFLSIGNIIAQFISLIGAFYIPKLLGAEQYGIYNTVTAFVLLFSVFTFEGLNKVIIREASVDIKKLKEILEATFGLKIIFAILSSLFCVFLVLFIDYDSGTKIYIAIFSISLLLRGTNGSINSIYQANENMKILALFSIVTQLIQVPIAIFLLKMGNGVLSLILLQLSVNLIALVINYFYSKNFILFNPFSKIKFLAKYLKSGFNFTLLGIAGALSEKIDLVMLSFMTTPANVGIYALAYNIANKGLIIRGPISQSLFPYYSKRLINKQISIKTLFNQTLAILLPTVFIAMFVTLFSKYLIVNFIGVEYAKSAVVLNILIFYLIMNYATIPFGLALQVTNNELKLVYLNVVRAIINIVGNLLFFKYYGIIGIAYSTLLGATFIAVSQILISRKTMINYLKPFN